MRSHKIPAAIEPQVWRSLQVLRPVQKMITVRSGRIADSSHYKGASTERGVAPPVLGRLGRGLQELAVAPVARRSRWRQRR